MTHTTCSTALLVALSLLPVTVAARQDRHPQANVNSRYTIEHASISGVPESRISQAVRDDIKKLIGEKFNQDEANAIADRIQHDLGDYSVRVKVARGSEAEHVKVTFEVRRVGTNQLALVPPLVYYTGEGFSGALNLTVNTHHNVVSFGLVNTADRLLEREAGYNLRYEHRRVATDRIQLRVDYEWYHQTFKRQVQDALASAPDVPGVYRIRQNFAPSVALIPVAGVTVRFGTSFQNLQVQYPLLHNRRAYAFTADVQLRHVSASGGRGLRQTFSADYGMRAASRALGTDFEYTRHMATADYTVSQGHHLFAVHGRVGRISGTAPLFERFSLGNAFTLRGWNKFDVAPLGGSRLAYGSVEYRYGLFQAFYDVGSVWDPEQRATVRHSVGIGLVSNHGLFVSIAYPVRLQHVKPVLMFGVKF